jgi:hypothetical protein
VGLSHRLPAAPRTARRELGRGTLPCGCGGSPAAVPSPAGAAGDQRRHPPLDENSSCCASWPYDFYVVNSEIVIHMIIKECVIHVIVMNL